MKYLFLFLFLLLSLSFGQVPVWEYDDDGTKYSAWSTTNFNYLLTSEATATYSKTFYLRSMNQSKEFNGLVTLFTELDTLASDTSTYSGLCEPDTIIFFPEYWGGRSIGWITGDTITWRQAVDDTSMIAVSDLKKLIIPTHVGYTFFWNSSPTDSLMQGSAFNNFRVVAKTLDTDDSTAIYISQEISVY